MVKGCPRAGPQAGSDAPRAMPNTDGGRVSLESLEQFKQTVFDDDSLAALLRAEDDRERFVALVVRLGAERGYAFTAREIAAAMREARSEWLRRLV